MPDLISTALAKKGVDGAVDTAKSFLSKLLGPAVDELGAVLHDRVRMYRLQNQVRMLGEAQEMLERAGVTPEPVPLRLLLPLLDGAALEDDQQLSRKWAALLANAAHLELRKAVHPSFVRILSELSPKDAAVLELLWVRELGLAEDDHASVQPDELLRTIPNITRPEVELVTDNLVRLQLCAIRGVMVRGQPDRIPGDRRFALTFFGRSFIRACQPLRDVPISRS